jgi:ubiquinone/menaquinone biosynthesis C-methylase UbiE
MVKQQGTEPDLSYFGLQAYIGTTKHMGGTETTRALVELCHIAESTSLLDVGCGAGATASNLAKEIGCQVMAVDLRQTMVDLARERAEREGVLDHIQFRAADAQDLPFENGQFDVVLSESVATFVEDKPAVIREYARVTRAGGYVGLNEEVWLQAPTQEMVEYARLTWGIDAQIPAQGGWVPMMEEAGLREIVVREYQLDPRRESTQVGRYGCRELRRMLSRTLGLYVKSPAFRAYMRARRLPPKGLFAYLGYGIYVGSK